MNQKIFETLPGFAVNMKFEKPLQDEVGRFTKGLAARNAISEKMQENETEINQIDNSGRPKNNGEDDVQNVFASRPKPTRDPRADGRKRLELLKEQKKLAREIVKQTLDLQVKRLELLPLLDRAARAENGRLVGCYDKARADLVGKLIALTIPSDAAEQIADSAQSVRDAAGPADQGNALGCMVFVHQHFPATHFIGPMYHTRLFHAGDSNVWRKVSEACESESLANELADA
jgi:hypothetical protein